MVNNLHKEIDLGVLVEMIRKSILHILSNDPKSMPLNILVSKTIREVKTTNSDIFIKESTIMNVLKTLEEEELIGRNKYGKYFIDFIDFPAGDVVFSGLISLDKFNGNGYITTKVNGVVAQKSSHFVHRRNLNGAKEGDVVEFAELLVDNKRNGKFNLVDAKVLKVLS